MVPVTRWFRPPGVRGDGPSEGDIAILKLDRFVCDYDSIIYFTPEDCKEGRVFVFLACSKKPIKFTRAVKPVCLPSGRRRYLRGDKFVVTGWGSRSAHSGSISQKPRETVIPYVSDSTCRSVYGGAFNSRVEFCAGHREGGKDSCQGDSGGPLSYKDRKTGKWELAGIVSWGDGCAEREQYGLNTRVTKFLSWIKQTACRQSKFRSRMNC